MRRQTIGIPKAMALALVGLVQLASCSAPPARAPSRGCGNLPPYQTPAGKKATEHVFRFVNRLPPELVPVDVCVVLDETSAVIPPQQMEALVGGLRDHTSVDVTQQLPAGSHVLHVVVSLRRASEGGDYTVDARSTHPFSADRVVVELYLKTEGNAPPEERVGIRYFDGPTTIAPPRP
jgi:hypothetical protein